MNADGQPLEVSFWNYSGMKIQTKKGMHILLYKSSFATTFIFCVVLQYHWIKPPATESQRVFSQTQPRSVREKTLFKKGINIPTFSILQSVQSKRGIGLRLQRSQKVRGVVTTI